MLTQFLIPCNFDQYKDGNRCENWINYCGSKIDRLFYFGQKSFSILQKTNNGKYLAKLEERAASKKDLFGLVLKVALLVGVLFSALAYQSIEALHLTLGFIATLMIGKCAYRLTHPLIFELPSTKQKPEQKTEEKPIEVQEIFNSEKEEETKDLEGAISIGRRKYTLREKAKLHALPSRNSTLRVTPSPEKLKGNEKKILEAYKEDGVEALQEPDGGIKLGKRLLDINDPSIHKEAYFMIKRAMNQLIRAHKLNQEKFVAYLKKEPKINEFEKKSKIQLIQQMKEMLEGVRDLKEQLELIQQIETRIETAYNHKNLLVDFKQMASDKRLISNQLKLGIDLLTKGAEEGIQDACYQLALCYAEGIGCKADQDKAIEMMKKANINDEDFEIWFERPIWFPKNGTNKKATNPDLFSYSNRTLDSLGKHVIDNYR